MEKTRNMTLTPLITTQVDGMSYLDSAEGLMITRKRALQELRAHSGHDGVEVFYKENGLKEEYNAGDVLRFLGY